MLKKIEHFYLSILRVFIMVLATTLLIASIVLGVYGLNAFKKEPEKPKSPKITYDQFINSLILPKDQANNKNMSDSQKKEEISNKELEQGYYNKIANIIYDFLKKHSQDTFLLDKDLFKFEFESNTSRKFLNDDVKIAYLKGLSDIIERATNDKNFIEYTNKISAKEAIDQLLRNYDSEYIKQITNAEAEYTLLLKQSNEKKEKAIKSLYLAGGLFAIFLSIVFLAIFLRIEINLRNLEKLAQFK
ncbi:MAG: hypothetical protein N2505_04735 [Endomicrobia bacterium]|nr:hypothetical protein [Endomicrobiia bacterium]